MGWFFVIQYDLTPNSRYLCCKTCHTQIALVQDVISAFTNANTLLLEKAVNVILGPPRNFDYEQNLILYVSAELREVYCVACNMLLGHKIIQMDPFHYTLRPGRLELKKQKLLFWNGQQMIDAVTMFPPWP